MSFGLKRSNPCEKNEIRRATSTIGPLLSRSVQEQKAHKTPPNWRVNGKNFLKKNSIHHIEPGAVTFSSGWFGQGHEVSFRYIFLYYNN